MDNELYLKRFFIEQYNDETMYYEYLKGNVFLDRNILSIWLKEMEIKNSVFASSINDFKRLNNKKIIIETSLSNNLCVSKHFFNKSEATVGEFGKFKIEKKSLGNSCNHYICNGLYI